MSCCSKRCGCCAFVDFVALIPGMFEVNAFGLEVSCETAVIVCSLVIPGGVCIAIVIFSAFSLSPCFGGMIVHFTVCAIVLLASVSSFASSSATLSAMATATATTTISATEV